MLPTNVNTQGLAISTVRVAIGGQLLWSRDWEYGNYRYHLRSGQDEIRNSILHI